MTAGSVPPPPPPPPPPRIPPLPSVPPAPGYVSPEGKKTFITTVVVLAVVCFVAQIVLPFVVSMALMPAFMFGSMSELAHLQVTRAAVWDGRVWYIRETAPFGGAAQNQLMSLPTGSDEEAEAAASLSTDEVWLLPGKDRLWVISSEAVAYYKDGRLRTQLEQSLDEISRPFMYQGRPAVIEEGLAGQCLKVFQDGRWQEKAWFHLVGPPAFSVSAGQLLPVAVGDEIHLFFQAGYAGPVHYRKGLPADDEEDSDAWETVALASGTASAVALGDKPALFVGQTIGPREKVIGLKRSGETWEEFFTHSAGLPGAVGVCPTGEDDDFILLLQGFPGSARIVEVKGGKAGWQSRQGRGFPFPRGFMLLSQAPYLLSVIPPLVMALVLTSQMRKHRIGEYVHAGEVVRFASMTRRGVAAMLDGLLVSGPYFVALPLMFRNLWDFFDVVRFMLTFFGVICGSLLWSVLMFFLFSILEGTRGRTPGKWLAGIRVLKTDLSPCGIGRGLLRNLLRIADGFGSYVVGMLVAALTEKWQRVGDLAADTIVIRAPRRRQRDAEHASFSAGGGRS